MTTATLLLVAKAPVPGLVKTRLAADVGETTATAVAAAALLDTIDACALAVGTDRCRLSLSGDVSVGFRADEIEAAVAGWTVTAQRGSGLGERLANAHADVAGPVVQIGMDTPQVTPTSLLAVAAGLRRGPTPCSPPPRTAAGGHWRSATPSAATGPCATSRCPPPTRTQLFRSALEARGLRWVFFENGFPTRTTSSTS
ncbi:hypothetical protein NBCG_00270, partial [Nocardioidaceae bacterium Broad-1]